MAKNNATDQASGIRHSDRAGPRSTSVWSRTARGSHAAAATSGGDRPHGQRRLPAAAEQVLERHRQPGADGCAQRDAGRHHAHEQSDGVLVAVADEHREQHLGERDGGPGEQRAGEQGSHAADATHAHARGGQQRAGHEHALDREALGQARSHRRQRTEQDHGQGGDQPRDRAGQAEVVADVGHQRRQAGEDRAQVDGQQEDQAGRGDRRATGRLMPSASRRMRRRGRRPRSAPPSPAAAAAGRGASTRSRSGLRAPRG